MICSCESQSEQTDRECKLSAPIAYDGPGSLRAALPLDSFEEVPGASLWAYAGSLKLQGLGVKSFHTRNIQPASSSQISDPELTTQTWGCITHKTFRSQAYLLSNLSRLKTAISELQYTLLRERPLGKAFLRANIQSDT